MANSDELKGAPAAPTLAQELAAIRQLLNRLERHLVNADVCPMVVRERARAAPRPLSPEAAANVEYAIEHGLTAQEFLAYVSAGGGCRSSGPEARSAPGPAISPEQVGLD